MELTGGKYLQPSPSLRELLLLDALKLSPHRSQAELAEIIGVTPAMVNAYIARFESEGIISKEIHGRRVTYWVTPKGSHLQEYHLITYLAELSSLASKAQGHFRSLFRSLSLSGVRTVVFYGAGETSAVVGAAINEEGAPVLIGIVDDDPEKQGNSLLGHTVTSPEAILQLRPDLVLVTTWAFAHALVKRVDWIRHAGLQVRSLFPLTSASNDHA